MATAPYVQTRFQTSRRVRLARSSTRLESPHTWLDHPFRLCYIAETALVVKEDDKTGKSSLTSPNQLRQVPDIHKGGMHRFYHLTIYVSTFIMYKL